MNVHFIFWLTLKLNAKLPSCVTVGQFVYV